jgi:hypothetical protein
MRPEEALVRGDESPTARRILAIDDEIEALERLQPRSRGILYGVAVLVMSVLVGAIGIVASGADVSQYLGYLLPTLGLVAVPSGILSLQLLKNRRKRLALERELDALIAESATERRSRGRGDAR